MPRIVCDFLVKSDSASGGDTSRIACRAASASGSLPAWSPPAGWIVPVAGSMACQLPGVSFPGGRAAKDPAAALAQSLDDASRRGRQLDSLGQNPQRLQIVSLQGHMMQQLFFP